MSADGPLDLRVENLRVDAADGRTLLDIPHLSLEAGAWLAVLGPSGAGKSTLLHVLAGLTCPARGRVLWDGTDIAGLSEPRRVEFRRLHLGLVFQEPMLFEELSAEANAAIAAGWAAPAARAARREEGARWLNRIGLGGRVADRVSHLSGGERQRVAVARALVGAPRALLADEPTASLDRISANALIDDLAGLGRAHTLIAVTHDPLLAARADRRITIEDGRVIEADAAPSPDVAASHPIGDAAPEGPRMLRRG